MSSADFAVPANAPEVTPPTIGVAAAGEVAKGSLFSNAEITLSLLIFVLAILSIAVFCYLSRSGFTDLSARIFVIILLVFGTLLVVSSAYSSEQIAPVVGFFGTVAGYLLGRSERT